MDVLGHGVPATDLANLTADDEVMRPDPDDKPVLPEQSEEETGTGWGEAPEPDDDERLRRDRPPHWDR
jgi:hypothetical protein